MICHNQEMETHLHDYYLKQYGKTIIIHTCNWCKKQIEENR
jgi:hypothetical protein